MKNQTCMKCGSNNIIPRVPVIDRGSRYFPLSAMIIEKPDAMIFTHAHTFPISAWVCGECGYAEFYVEDAKGLKESYQRFLDEARKKAE